jgi:phosphoribosylformimino-5-aminoimidazole carboxamide ribotide isomerase
LPAVGSIAVKDEETFTDGYREFGVDKFMIGADVKEEKLAVKVDRNKLILSVLT